MSERDASQGHQPLDAALEVLSGQKHRWVRASYRERLVLLDEMHDILREGLDHEAWAADALAAMGLPRDAETPLALEMIVNAQMIADDLEAHIDTLAALELEGGLPAVQMRRSPSGQIIADVYPRPWQSGDAKGPNAGLAIELRLSSPARGQEFLAKRAAGHGQVSLVLGAGNQGFISITDALHALFVEQQVVLLKHHPLRAYNDRWCQRLFAPLIREGYFRSIVGDAAVSKRAVEHPLVDVIHMTGGKATHDAIVWGGGTEAERAARKRANAPVIQKPITSELGCVTPWIVAPGEYDERALRHQAEQLSAAFAQNNSANCCAPKVLVVSEAWPQKEAFLGALMSALERRAHIPPYYPGMGARFSALVERYRGTAGFTQILSAVGPRAFGALGSALPWTVIRVPFEEAVEAGRPGAEPHPLLSEEPFCPVLGVCEVPGSATLEDFLPRATALANASFMGTLSATLVVRDADREAAPVRAAIDDLRYGTIGVNVWTGACVKFATGAWGAAPGETIDGVVSGIGFVRNALLFDAPEKTVVYSPLVSDGHVGTKPPPSLAEARKLVALVLGNTNTARANENNPICAGNFRPLSAEHAYGALDVEGRIPAELEGMYVRNGTNQALPPTGKMHMYDGDAMLHCIRFGGGKVTAYANTWVKTPRFTFNARIGRDAYATFGDMAMGGVEVARKLRHIRMKQKTGAIEALGVNRRANPSTSTALLGRRMFAVSEVSEPFQIFIDPSTGVVTSGAWEDFSKRMEVFSAHYRVCPDTGEVHYIGKPLTLGALQAAGARVEEDGTKATYGVLNREGELVHQLVVPLRSPAPLFLHDVFLTQRFMIIVEHSLRIELSSLSTTGPFVFRRDMNLRFGVIPRRGTSADAIRWFDLGRPAMVYHALAGWEENERLVLWLPMFEEYPASVPIHLAEEPPSFLRRVVLDLVTGKVVEDVAAPGLEQTPGERCEVNRRFYGKKQRWGYLMKRAEGREMYDGFVKYDLLESRPHAVVSYGEGRLGGEAFFVPRPSGTREDDGWLMDIVYDAKTDGSELCIWDASTLSEGCEQPVARVHMPQRVPFGVHASFLTPAELEAQWALRPR